MRKASMAVWGAAILGVALLASGSAIAAGGGGMGDAGAFGDAGPSGPSPEELQQSYNDGVAALEAQDWKKAVSKFQFVTDGNPNMADAWNYLGYSSRRAGNPKKSEAAYKRALKLDPKHPRANEYYGELLLELNREPEAEQRLAVLQACCASDPNTAALANQIALVKAGKPLAANKPPMGY